MQCTDWPYRWQASSHRGCVNNEGSQAQFLQRLCEHWRSCGSWLASDEAGKAASILRLRF
ncbi:hypothetical protein EMIT0P395_220025 [Pseudomonas sp. IT-P395]